MKRNSIRIGVLAALFLCLVATVVFAAQDLFALKSPNGIAFSEVRRLRDLGERCPKPDQRRYQGHSGESGDDQGL